MHYTNDFRDFAIAAHGQQLYGDKPYVYHLDQVNDILRSNNYLEEAKMSYLHDVIEDTDITFDDIKDRFGLDIAWIIEFCSDKKVGGRKERKMMTYVKCLSFIKKYLINIEGYEWIPIAIRIKVADRLANIIHSKSNRPGKYQMYLSEFDGFEQVYFVPGVCDSLWKLMAKTLEIESELFYHHIIKNNTLSPNMEQ